MGDDPVVDDAVDIAINSYFQNLHAALQVSERDIRTEVVRQRNLERSKLTTIKQDLHSNAETLKELVRVAKTVVNRGGGEEHRVNVKEMEERLHNVAKLPCFFEGEGCPENREIE